MTNNKRSRHRFRRNFSPAARKFLLFLIPFLSVVIIITIVCANIFSPENQVKSRFSALATYYYENVFYEGLIHSSNFSGDPEKALQNYQDSGLPTISLRQFSLYDQTKASDDVKYLIKYCDENVTTVTLYPDPPYTQTSHHAEYKLSCNF